MDFQNFWVLFKFTVFWKENSLVRIDPILTIDFLELLKVKSVFNVSMHFITDSVYGLPDVLTLAPC